MVPTRYASPADRNPEASMSLTDAGVPAATRLTDGLFTTDVMRTLFSERDRATPPI
jgi:hypothetical protein